MMRNKSRHIAKPFVKWAGGKSQLLGEIDKRLPMNVTSGEEVTYVEPFVGGGAVLFYLLSEYPNIKHAIINDINARLMTTYRVIKERPKELIFQLKLLQDEYLPKNHEERTVMFMEHRKRYNTEQLGELETAALFIFLNRTCFNGLYRENSKGGFNVPHGRYKNPLICDEKTILADSELLQSVTILCGDFSETLQYAGEDTFFYFDPPYKPLSDTSSFNTYVKEPFDDSEQIRLRDFVNQISTRGSLFVLSNSDVKGKNTEDKFFDELYKDYIIKRVFAIRMVNANPKKRGKLTELMITNVQPYYRMEVQPIMMVSDSETEYRTIKNKNKMKNISNLIAEFQESLLETNRGYNYYIDLSNIVLDGDYDIEYHAMDALIGVKEGFNAKFEKLLKKLPTVVAIFPLLFALSKAERKPIKKKELVLRIIDDDFQKGLFYDYKFSHNALQNGLSDEEIERYLYLFERVGLKHLYQNVMEKSTVDYIAGVLVGLDSNGRKNRGGTAFELALEPIVKIFCEKHGLKMLTQKKFKFLTKFGYVISKDIENRKADFFILNSDNSKCINIEVNFYNGSGSKPEEIIDSYINRQRELKAQNIDFILITDGKECWGKPDKSQLTKGFNHLNYLMNYKMAKSYALENALIEIFE